MSLCDRCGKTGQTTSTIDTMLTKSQVRRAAEKHFDHEYEKVCGCNNCEFLEEIGLGK